MAELRPTIIKDLDGDTLTVRQSAREGCVAMESSLVGLGGTNCIASLDERQVKALRKALKKHLKAANGVQDG